MVRKILSIVLVLLNCTSIYSYDWHLISDSVRVSQERICPLWCYDKVKDYASLRSTRYIINKIHAEKGDTLLFMEHYHQDKDELYASFWFKDKQDSYIAYDKYINIHRNITESVFTFYSIYLCNRWDIDTIRKEEQENSINKNIYIMATRIILGDNSSFTIDCIFFKTFYYTPRDQNYIGKVF